jgi:DNA-binding NtrC family response regulator
MSLVAFFSKKEIITPGLLAGEPVKGPLLKTIEIFGVKRILLLVSSQESNSSMEELIELLPAGVILEKLIVEAPSIENLNTLVESLLAQKEKFHSFGQAMILSSGTAQQLAALWILKNSETLKGEFISPPDDYSSDYLPQKPFVLQVKEPSKSFGSLKEIREINDENDETHDDFGSSDWSAVAQKVGCIGKSPAFRRTLEESAAMAAHPTPILLMGETGCGKEVIARFVHELSPRAGKPLVTVNCAALPETLAESILFGHEKGSFTGAYKRQSGKFEQASGGTLFLDELGELALFNQAKLLRVLETRQVDPLGAMEPVNVDVRVIAATNRDLRQEVAQGRFREDLYYRLRAGEIQIPPLRDRASDIPLISLHLLARFNRILANPKQLSKSALKFLEAQRWPGNVRDLMNTIERAVLMCPRAVIEPEDFRVDNAIIKNNGNNGTYGNGNGQNGSNGFPLPLIYHGFVLEDYLHSLRVRIFEKALTQAGGSKAEAARLLGISPQAVHKFAKAQMVESGTEK